MFSSPIFWALLLLSFCFCSFTFVLGRRALCPVRQLFKNCHIYHLQHSQAVVGCAFLKLTRHLVIIIHRLVSFLLLLASSPDGFIFKHRQSTIGCVCTLARKVVLLIGSIITFFFFLQPQCMKEWLAQRSANTLIASCIILVGDTFARTQNV